MLLLLDVLVLLVSVMVVHGLSQVLNLFDRVCHQILIVVMLLERSLWDDSVVGASLLSCDFVAHLVDSLKLYVLQWHELLLHSIKLRQSVSRFLYLLLLHNMGVIKAALCFESLVALLLQLLELLSLLIFINGSVFIFQKLLVLILRESRISLLMIRILLGEHFICEL